MRHRRQRRRIADGMGDRPHGPLRRGGVAVSGYRLGDASRHGGWWIYTLGTVDEDATVGGSETIHGALADLLRQEFQDSHDGDHGRVRPPHSDRGKRGIVLRIEGAEGPGS